MVLLSARLNDGAANTRTTGALITKRFAGFRVILTAQPHQVHPEPIATLNSIAFANHGYCLPNTKIITANPCKAESLTSESQATCNLAVVFS